MLKTLISTVALAFVIAACSEKPVIGPIPGGPYKDVTFEMNEAALLAAHPEVKCKQMANPVVKMCHGKGSEEQDITFLFHTDKLININGHTQY